MRPHDAREPLPAEHGAGLIAQAAAAFSRIAKRLEGAEDPAPAFTEARQLCEAASSDAVLDAEARQIFQDLVTAVETWRTVWPRLGGRSEFRGAVIREAGQWARRLKCLS